MLTRKLSRLLVACLPTHFLRQGARKLLLTTSRAVANDMVFDVEPSIFWDNYNRGHWEPDTYAFYMNHVSPDRDVIDIGGWIGPTMLLAYAFNARRVYVAEADPANFQILKRNVRRNYLEDRVAIFNTCLSDASGTIVRFGAAKKKKGSSTKRIGFGDTKVITTSISEFLGQFDLSAVSIVKIDIEGAEQDIVACLDDIAAHAGISVLLSIHVPLWRDKDKTIAALQQKFARFDVFDEAETPLTPEAIKQRFEKGGYFAFILKTRA